MSKITEETLKAAVPGLTDEQVGGLMTVVGNYDTARETEFNAKFREVYTGIDNVVKDGSGMERESNEKTSDYVGRVVKSLAEKNKELTDKLSAAPDRDKEMSAKQATIDDLTAKLNKISGEIAEEKKKHKAELLSYRIGADIEAQLGGFEYKEGYSPAMLEMAKRTAVETVKGMNPQYIKDNASGSERLVFHTPEGVELRDQQFALMGAGDLLKAELEKLGVLADVKAGGAGGHGDPPRGGGNPFGGATTRQEAYAMIENSLLAKGLVRGSIEFNKEKSRLMQEHGEKLRQLA